MEIAREERWRQPQLSEDAGPGQCKEPLRLAASGHCPRRGPSPALLRTHRGQTLSLPLRPGPGTQTCCPVQTPPSPRTPRSQLDPQSTGGHQLPRRPGDRRARSRRGAEGQQTRAFAAETAIKSAPETSGIFHCREKNQPRQQKTLSLDPARRVKQSPQGASSTLNSYFLLQMGGARVRAPPARTSAARKPCKDQRKPLLLGDGCWRQQLREAEGPGQGRTSPQPQDCNAGRCQLCPSPPVRGGLQVIACSSFS